ncbi:MerR family transcriptional regulator [Arthrobacter sp. zg-Y820]|uniref:transcriptional regulator FtsR n=1 Tax=unclassified Arthrobacter TaxID=235627 RepID=UPI001E54F861|nr:MULTISPECIES: MerR family transcriptional regulator [unclassified Arthrobacter]MCC9197892.1 MerR family transcriptional regulator [Arthrobacter sp. zg-Y820]MDK1280759.1 MerR family transcriptional regulator [Arthrobacter sp. zg.Y820]WIB10615.1 MerR family transcriptional regulator [Arthrobacter sp. zg-Y820]
MSASQPVRRTLGTGNERLRGRVLNIGEVLSELSADFPGISASKIRFLEEKGLVTPQRTAAGYRKYTSADVERLRFVLALQRDQYLPLKIIKDYLDAIDRGERPESLPGGMSLTPRAVSEQLAGELSARTFARALTFAELVRESGASADLVRNLAGYGLIASADNGAEQGAFDEHALKIAKACAKLQAHGIEPRHLRPFRAAADRELGLVESVVAPLASRRDVASKARAAETAREISDLCLNLHSALVNGHIARMEG